MVKKCAIVGLGQIGMMYDLYTENQQVTYTHAKALSTHPAFDLVCGVDFSELQKKIFSQHYKKPAYSNIASALEKHKVDIVIIATNTPSHYAILKEILHHSKPEAILCEKPLSYSIKEAKAMVNLCKKNNVEIFVNYMRRVSQGAVEIKSMINSGKIKKNIKGVAWYSKGFLHNGSHLFNLLEFWLGAFIKSKIINKGRLINNLDSEPDIYVEFENGKIVFMSAKEEDFSHYTIELLSPSGRLRYDDGGNLITWQKTSDHLTIPGYKILNKNLETIVNETSHYQLDVFENLLNALLLKSHTLCSGDEALETIIAMHRAIKKKV